jgi:peptide subunit release factor 1 (eRF1)
MLDELLGRAALKERIDELEEETESLRNQLDAESERRADAVSARQQAEERVNRLEDRIAELRDRVERAGESDDDAPTFRGVESLRGERRDEVLSRLRSFETGPEGALTAMVDEEVPVGVRDALGDRASLVARASPCLVVADDAGLLAALLRPPLAPAPFVEWSDSFRVDPAWFRPEGRLTFGLLRSDLFALGVYEDGERRELETVESDVMGTHSKGGFSQDRFERRRDEQIRAHLDACREVLDGRTPETLVLVGERTVLDDFEPVDRADAVATVDATGDPEEALDDAFRSFWTTRLYRL